MINISGTVLASLERLRQEAVLLEYAINSCEARERNGAEFNLSLASSMLGEVAKNIDTASDLFRNSVKTDA